MIESGGGHAVKKGGNPNRSQARREASERISHGRWRKREREREPGERPDGLKAVHVAARVDRENGGEKRSMRCGGQQNQNA